MLDEVYIWYGVSGIRNERLRRLGGSAELKKYNKSFRKYFLLALTFDHNLFLFEEQ